MTKWMINMRKQLLIIAFVLLCAGLSALRIELNVDAAAWQAKSPNYPVLLNPGEPMLPYYPVRILLPYGESYEGAEISLSKHAAESRGIYIDFARAQQPISLAHQPQSTTPDPGIYANNQFFPAQDWDFLGTQYYRGYQIAVFNVYPFKYNPVSGTLQASQTITLEINSRFDAAEAEYQARFVTRTQETMSQLGTIVANPELQSTYQGSSLYRNVMPSRNIDLSIPKKMIIITDAQRAPWFAEYITWKESHNISTGLFLTDEIYANYTGVDNAAKVRNFIIDAYSNWADSSTPLEYVILGGDDEVVPERGVYGRVGSTVDNAMPSDLYFSNLDGTWNANNNQIYGEQSDSVDYLPEVHIGRFPAETYIEFDNIFRKTKYYVDNSTFSNNIAIFFGENLNNNPLTWGGDYKDDVAIHLPNAYQYSTQYQRDNTYSSTGVWNTINNGVNVMNHMGHANETYLMGQGLGTIQSLRNTEYGFLYSQGCYPSAFDQRTSGAGESIGEHLLTSIGALFAFIGNTRYGWYMPGGIDGASQFYDRQYFIGLYEQSQTQLGKALTYSRVQNLNAAMSNDVMRWCYFEVILFGDPTISAKFPDQDLPMLSLEEYYFDDPEGDGDGIINPGELIRFYPTVRNASGWADATNVSIRIEGVPTGVTVLGPCPMIAQIPAGATNPSDVYISIQLAEIMGYGTFNMKVVVESAHPVTGQSTGLKTYDVSFDITLLDSRFPWESPHSGKSAPLVADFNGDGNLDITYTDIFGNVNLIGNSGVLYNSFAAPSQQNINRSGAMGQIDGVGGDDLAFVSRTGNIYALTSSGELIFNYQAPTAFVFSPMIADINGDGVSEVVAGGLDGKIYAITSSGADLAGFPLHLGSTFQSELAACDLDDNGAMEIICGLANGEFRVVKSGGLIEASYSRNLGAAVTGSPVVLSNNRIAVATSQKLFLIDTDGSIVFEKPLPAQVAGGLTLADLNRDYSLDIVFVLISGEVYAVNQQGQDLPGFPVSTNDNFNCPPLIADIDSDSQYEIILHSQLNSLHVYNHDGSIAEGFPFATIYNGATPGTLVDLDNSGYFMLVTGYSNGILVANLRRPVSDLTPWITYRGNTMRHGAYATTGFVANDNQVQSPALDKLGQNFPNPFNPNTRIAFSTATTGNVSLEIFNAKGQKVRCLHKGTLSAGNHTLNWDGRDDSGVLVSSGVYLYRMKTSGSIQTKKMLMLK